MIAKADINRQYLRKVDPNAGDDGVFAKNDRQTLRRATQLGTWWRGLDGVWRDEAGRTVTITQKLRSGRFFNLLEPSPSDFSSEDLALGLSRENRWSGQTSGEYGFSVAQHSVFVVRILKLFYPKITTNELLYALLHDAEEGLGIKDTITGLKYVIGDRYIEMGFSIREAVHHKYNLPWPAKHSVEIKIKKADEISGATEAVQLMDFTVDQYTKRIGKKIQLIEDADIISNYVDPWSPKYAEDRYLEELHQLLSAQR